MRGNLTILIRTGVLVVRIRMMHVAVMKTVMVICRHRGHSIRGDCANKHRHRRDDCDGVANPPPISFQNGHAPRQAAVASNPSILREL